ncbi:uncharacterized protein LOC136084017 isoform X1 [Hydra vulgaris]|uniref:Uncharacterized protein LOC136084017 isoform X1 n=1 Tax=Hydra vulgaris TaxID=6087 RepID=A0ABM4CEJ6_HYDVU
MSYWTKRRMVVKYVKRFLDDYTDDQRNILPKTANNANLQLVISPDIARNHVVQCQSNVSTYEIDANLDSILNNSDCYPESSDTESSGDSILHIDYNLRFNLAQWSIEFGITEKALSSLLKVLQNWFPELPNDSCTLRQTKLVMSVDKISGGQYYHFGVESGIKSSISNLIFFNDLNCISIQVNIDGLPLFRSSNGQFWPILGLIEYHQNNIQKNKSPFIIGLFYGKSKPSNCNEFLKKFVEESKALLLSGIVICGKLYKFSISAVICDSPARAFVKACKGHGGYFGCDKCCQKGFYIGRVTFPILGAKLRTDQSFFNMTQKKHHNGESVLLELGIGMVTQFPHDYMHLVCLGVVRKLLYIWLKGPLHVRLGARDSTRLSVRLVGASKYIPKEFARKPRAVSEFERWKATELRQFLLYTGVVYLADILNEAMYKNFLLLSVAMRILLCPKLCLHHAVSADTFLNLFIKHTSDIYGPEMITYNVHGLSHLCQDAIKYGPLDNISAFPFENYLGQLKKLIRKPNFPLQQVQRRLHEKNLLELKAVELKYPILKQQQNIRLPNDITDNESQHKQVILRDFCIKCTVGDSCCQLKTGEIIFVQNIVKKYGKDGDILVLYNTFESVETLFTYPWNSSSVGIYLVCNLSDNTKSCSIGNIDKKYTLLLYNQKYAALPLLHF